MKLLVSDYDGTFYTSEEAILKNIQQAHKWREKGNFFAIATGRGFPSIMNVIQKYNIPVDYVICDHGSFICNNHEEMLLKRYLSQHEKDLLKNMIQKYGQYIVKITCNGTYDKVEFDSTDNAHINIRFDNYEHAKQMDLENEEIGLIHSYVLEQSSTVEVVPCDVDKASAISFLLSYLNISEDDCYTVGNSENDISMIEFYHGFTLESAEEEVKLHTDKIVNQVSDVFELLIN